MVKKNLRLIDPVDYIYKTDPFKHQVKALDLSWDLPAFALFMEQGTGKTKIIIDNAAKLYMAGKISCLVVIAPNGVHRNWIENEVAKHMPDHIPVISRWWDSKRTKTKKYQKYLNGIWNMDKPHFRIFTINIDAITTKLGKSFLEKILRSFECMLVVDESQMIKNQIAQRTKAAINFGKYCEYRRILTGTPVTQSPLDLYTQFRFLDPEILGFNSFYTFRNHYALLEMDYNWATKQKYTVVVGFQNLERLKKDIKPFSYRITKDECLDLPPKLFQIEYVDLSPKQRKIYDELADSLTVEFEGMALTSPLAITKLLRLQQIIGGYYPTDEGGQIPIDKENMRVQRVIELAEQVEGKFIIWARFVEEIKAISKALKKKFGAESTVEYYGAIKSDARKEAEIKFLDRKSKVRFFVGNVKSGGRGLDLYTAWFVIYYSNDFSLEARLQSEARAHRYGLKNKVTYIDFVAPDTLDQKTIIPALRSKKNVADFMTGDNVKDWI